MTAKKTVSFADAFAQAQQYVDRMEQEDIPLEEMLSCYEQGMQALNVCKQKLLAAEQKITEIQSTHKEITD